MDTGNTEVLLFLPTQFMYRFEEKATPKSLADWMNKIQKKEEVGLSESGLDFIEQLLARFRDLLDHRYYSDTFVINRDKNQFFALFFFTSHIYGFEKFLEAKWQIDAEQGRGWHYQSGMPTLFSNLEKRPSTEKFERKLINYLKTKRSNLDVYKFTLKSGFLPKHAVEIMKSLQDLGQLRVEFPDGGSIRRNVFYVNWESFKSKDPKSWITLK